MCISKMWDCSKTIIALLIAIIVFFVFLIVLTEIDEKTSSNEYCVSCKEMKKIGEEYKKTIHGGNNRTGVAIRCADCHLSKRLSTRVSSKTKKIKDLWINLLGTYPTTKSFESRRIELAPIVQQEMIGLGVCESHHNIKKMDIKKQKWRYARNSHKEAKTKKIPCLHCHDYGIGHYIP